MRFFVPILLSFCSIISVNVFAHGPRPPSLIGAPVPPVPGLLDGPDPIVVDKSLAIVLGKALFWDIAVGSDGIACASCHFHAGTDRRVKNQINPGAKHAAPSSGQTFEPTPSGASGGPNYTLTKDDFPFFQFTNPFNNQSAILFASDDVVSSSGSFGGDFQTARRARTANDRCLRGPDPVFHVGALGTRKVEPRNTPSVINAVFNHRNFWDGRANNVFNGSSPWGERDPDAGVWVKIHARSVVKQRLHLINSSLASQAVAPPVNDTEMSCRQRIFPDLGRKLLMRRPLQRQKVHWADSVFGGVGGLSVSAPGDLKPGLKTTYATLIKRAFNPKYWSYGRRGVFGGPARGLPWSQMEANFAMFFGLAIQLYESTLISDQAPIDTVARNPLDFSPIDEAFFPLESQIGSSAYNGLRFFVEFHCNLCHSGPLLTSAAIHTNAEMVKADPDAFGPSVVALAVAINDNVVNKDGFFKGSALNDTGFVNTAVGDPEWDTGIDAKDDFGNPLSYTMQYVEMLAGNTSKVVDPGIDRIQTCKFQGVFALQQAGSSARIFTSPDGLIPDPAGDLGCFRDPAQFGFIPVPATAATELADPATKKLARALTGAFKIPSLRNVELTGPYMHNGSMATLDEVIEFYTRAGNLPNENTHVNIFPAASLVEHPELPSDDPVNVAARQNRKDLGAFLKTLTDDRVRYEKAPFDHPELPIPDGHPGDHFQVDSGNALDTDLALDRMLLIPAVGANGLSVPIQSFDQYLP